MGIRRYEGRPDELLQAMLLIRHYEERTAALQAESGVPGTCTAVGQEAAAVGVVSALDEHDLILTNHRSAGHLLARGADPGRMLAEVMGRRGGYCGGKSGSLHISAKELGVVLTSTIVGGELALATGVGLSQKMLRRQGVVVCFFGDGAACEGRFHESLNLAAVWQLPILYVCENNQWQAFVHRRETMVNDSIAAFAAPHGIDSAAVDGNDVMAVRAVATEALDAIRVSGRPFLLETRTYRLRGHFEPDDQSYVDPAELASWRQRDPLPRLQARMLESGQVTAAGLTDMDADARRQIDTAVAFAVDSPFPDADALLTDVYA
ncbi:thiamine pyrophosphate-dependent dehydrogenase E1 component subunit alpha [Azoarcus sp. L1K30]|uniref:thiamine pyrophosphate-dependent dehydrogenase E1 component subunit alpha n=1 Tax=Azoarcus sp. L1K30 TaxID=2820277 RepID=UPI001B829870|nr:thiamine pyrophosphate-dependent dehydrogenase E1 component subunit alpha [Azoarcus sp. L1K30]MBR0564635.1 thiamine pyrophosphate-dependent dehydrogenase E1 component subunit alpha [Azoarcus sp. L1K30]